MVHPIKAASSSSSPEGRRQDWAQRVAQYKEDKAKPQGISPAEEEYFREVETLTGKNTFHNTKYESYMAERTQYDGLDVDNSWRAWAFSKLLGVLEHYFPFLAYVRLAKLREYFLMTKGVLAGVVFMGLLWTLVSFW